MQRSNRKSDAKKIAKATATGVEVDSVQPWEQIENGRYMPRRIRGSCRGRELG
jgi:hypothetical protein